MKSKYILVITAFALAVPMGAQAQNRPWLYDRVEDRLDRIESRRDERVDLGRRDVIEDRIDRWESRRDEANKPSPRFISRWERRSIRARWKNAHSD